MGCRAKRKDWHQGTVRTLEEDTQWLLGAPASSQDSAGITMHLHPKAGDLTSPGSLCRARHGITAYGPTNGHHMATGRSQAHGQFAPSGLRTRGHQVAVTSLLASFSPGVSWLHLSKARKVTQQFLGSSGCAQG